MKLDDFLKIKKVRCIDTDNDKDLTIGKEYEVAGVDNDNTVKVIDDDNYCHWYNTKLFEPVLDTENPLQGAELTPESEAGSPSNDSPHVSEPQFKVGDFVYWGLKSRIFKVFRLMSANVLEVELNDVVIAVHKDELCLATLENYGKLCSLFERIDFEQPPKELKGSDLARAMLDKGWKYVPCYVGNQSDDFAQKTKLTDLIIALDGDRSKEFVGDDVWKYAVPFDPRTGEPLTEAVLDE